MRFLFILLIMVFSTPLQAQETSFWAFSKQWDSSHWNGQDFQVTDAPHLPVMRETLKSDQSLFGQDTNLSPQEFIENLKKANIIGRIYNPDTGFLWHRRTSDEVIIEVDHNFYTLSYADQVAVTSLLSRAYQKDHYALHDANTRRAVGQITPEGFFLY